jgi:formylmethanofuran dehydrogenase subunit C
MSDAVTLTVRATLDHSIDVECIAPDRFATLSSREIEALPVWAGREQRTLADYFTIRGERASAVRIVGVVRHASGIGSAMSGGSVLIDGDGGSHVGVGMAGGRIDVRGRVGDDAALGMTGGAVRVRGDAGDRVAAGVPGASRGTSGGEVVIEGSVGKDAGARMRRGLLFVGGDAGDCAARAIIAGTVIVLGRVGREPATDNKRGTLVVGAQVDVPSTYRFACRYESPHVRLALMHLLRQYHVTIDQRFVVGKYDRYCGDAGTVGKGEILAWTGTS